jgi:hypothetical protein
LLIIKHVSYFIKDIPPIIGKGLALPFKALTIPKIARINRPIYPNGKMINPINGIIEVIIVATIQNAIDNKNNTNPWFA